MAKTMRNVVITCIMLIVIAVGASALVMTGGCSAPASGPLSGFLTGALANPLGNAKTDTVNALIDASGVKDRVESELHAHVGEIADGIGVPASVVEYGIDALDIQNWQVADKPTAADASVSGTYSVDADGTSVAITAYDDPSLITVVVDGREMTLEVPESARDFAYLLPYLDYIQ